MSSSRSALHTDGTLPLDIEILDSVPEIRNRGLRALFTYWRGKVAATTPPRRTEIDPVEFPKLLPDVWIQEHVPGTTDFRCRLAGEAVQSRYSVSIVGRPFREIIGEAAWTLVSEQYMQAIEIPAIGYSIGPVYMHTIERSGLGERIFMPLSDDSGEIRFLLGATIHSPFANPAEDEPEITPRKTLIPLAALLE